MPGRSARGDCAMSRAGGPQRQLRLLLPWVSRVPSGVVGTMRAPQGLLKEASDSRLQAPGPVRGRRVPGARSPKPGASFVKGALARSGHVSLNDPASAVDAPFRLNFVEILGHALRKTEHRIALHRADTNERYREVSTCFGKWRLRGPESVADDATVVGVSLEHDDGCRVERPSYMGWGLPEEARPGPERIGREREPFAL